MLRSTRKTLGLAASADVGILAQMLRIALELVDTSEDPDLRVLASFPALLGLCQEDILDTIFFVGLRGIRNGYQYHSHELTAAYAGHGFGLDRAGVPLYSNDLTNNNFSVRPMLLVEYTRAALLLHHDWMNKALEVPAPSIALTTAYELGSNREPSEMEIIEFILRYLIRLHMIGHGGEVPKRITVIVTGSPESGADGKVQQVTRTAVEALHSEIESLDENPDYIAARGIAELAWRAVDQESDSETHQVRLGNNSLEITPFAVHVAFPYSL
jgi:hypothetical protein